MLSTSLHPQPDRQLSGCSAAGRVAGRNFNAAQHISLNSACFTAHARATRGRASCAGLSSMFSMCGHHPQLVKEHSTHAKQQEANVGS